MAVPIPPGVRSAVTRPWHVAAMEVDGGSIVLAARAHDRPIHGQDVLQWELVAERDLDWGTPLGGDDAAEMPERHRIALTVAP